jgi:ribonuclease VapC
MYFDADALTTILVDRAVRERTAEAIAAARRRFTSPLAVIETVLALAAKTGREPDEAKAEVEAFLDAAGIELRDLPPAHRLVALALAATPASAKAKAVATAMHKACADYYEAEPFSTEAPAAEPPQV